MGRRKIKIQKITDERLRQVPFLPQSKSLTEPLGHTHEAQEGPYQESHGASPPYWRQNHPHALRRH